MMLTSEQENKVHPFAVQFAIEHYQDAALPKGSVMLIAAENFAEANSQLGPNQLLIDCYLAKVDKILRILRNEAPARVMRG
jgi:hypothetical protein